MHMWMVNPKFMCDKHLLGEHYEIHLLAFKLIGNACLKGFLDKRIIEPLSLKTRHDELVDEMKSRGFNHNSEMKDLGDLVKSGVTVDREASLKELMDRCHQCKGRYYNWIYE